HDAFHAEGVRWCTDRHLFEGGKQFRCHQVLHAIADEAQRDVPLVRPAERFPLQSVFPGLVLQRGGDRSQSSLFLAVRPPAGEQCLAHAAHEARLRSPPMGLLRRWACFGVVLINSSLMNSSGCSKEASIDAWPRLPWLLVVEVVWPGSAPLQ